MGFLSTSEIYRAAVKYFAASPAPSRLLFSCYPVSETLSQAPGRTYDRTATNVTYSLLAATITEQ